MFGWVRRRDWRTSPAHLLLLSKFRGGDSPTRYRGVEHWEAVIREKAADAIARFVRDGMLEPAELQERVDYQFKVPDLKSMLRQRGLKVSGRKEDLIHRLIGNDTEAMIEATKGLDLYRCTVAGMQLAEDYLKKESIKREATEGEVLSLLTAGQFSKAVRLVAQYEAGQVFPRGLSIDWSNYDGSWDVESLKTIFTATPAILKEIAKDRLGQLRPFAGMVLLWGTGTPRRWLLGHFETGIYLDAPAVCRMLIFHAHYVRDMKEYKDAGIKMVEVYGTNDGATCPECRKINGRRYHLANMPELPYAKCMCESGCRCMVRPCFR